MLYIRVKGGWEVKLGIIWLINLNGIVLWPSKGGDRTTKFPHWWEIERRAAFKTSDPKEILLKLITAVQVFFSRAPKTCFCNRASSRLIGKVI